MLLGLRTGEPGPRREDSPVAVDAADRLLLDEAAPWVEEVGRGAVAVVDDRYGALALGAATLTARGGAQELVRVHQDSCTAAAALDMNGAALEMSDTYRHHALDAGLLGGARVVLARLPRGLAALRDLAEHVAREAAPDVVLLAVGRVKHMTPTMNDVLRESFTDVRASLARGRSRVLVARSPRPCDDGSAFTYPVTADLPDVGLSVATYGAAFAGASLDLGTRLLLEQLDAVAPPAGPDGTPHDEPGDVVDLGCGTGILAAWAARRWVSSRVVATDSSVAAVRSAGLTARGNDVGERVRVVLDDAGSTLGDASADLVLLNPPFHEGAAVRTGTAHRMFAAAARILRPGGELWCVWNSHLHYRGALERAVGPTVQLARDRRFTVTRSARR
ncbi:methyltransferase [Cellulosimicrobium arenosum]|uniref:Methyltransferase n=1 Tax=Cellulosimicrobium arenosum TaxID=2708133 RepID=A0A927J1M9_9MICO|nr:methyltransferase [Cellulosimicrobium arenosum]